MSVKRVLMVSHYYPPHTGGIEFVAQSQARRLVGLGHQVTVVSSRVSSNELPETVDEGVRVIRVKAWNFLEKKGIAFPLFSPRIVFVMLREARRADVVHVHDAFYISSLCAAFGAFVYRRPLVLTQHVALVPHTSKLTILIEKVVFNTSGRFIFHKSARILTLNGRVTDFLITLGVPQNKIHWMPNGVDDSLFHTASPAEKQAARQKYGLSPHGIIVLFVGRFVHKKGFDKVVASASDDYQLAFAGGVSKHKNTEKAQYIGQLSQADLAEVYRAADIFVLPSEGEGFPLSVQEAMTSGLPIVMADDEGYAPYKLNKQLVSLLQDTTPEIIKKRLTELAHNQAQRERMSDYSTSYALSFSWSKVIAELDATYDQVLSVSGSTS